MKNFSISQTACMLSLSKDTLRYYDKIGLVKPTRGTNRYRFYTDFDLLILQYVEVMKSIGLSLSQIGLILRNTVEKTEDDKRSTLGILKKKSSELNQKIRIYQEADKMLTQTIHSLENMDCPADMEQLDSMIKRIYTHMNECSSVEKEGEENG